MFCRDRRRPRGRLRWPQNLMLAAVVAVAQALIQPGVAVGQQYNRAGLTLVGRLGLASVATALGAVNMAVL